MVGDFEPNTKNLAVVTTATATTTATTTATATATAMEAATMTRRTSHAALLLEVRFAWMRRFLRMRRTKRINRTAETALFPLSTFVREARRRAAEAMVGSSTSPVDMAVVLGRKDDPNTPDGRAVAAYRAANAASATELLALLLQTLLHLRFATHDHSYSDTSSSCVLAEVLCYLRLWLLLPGPSAESDATVLRNLRNHLRDVWLHFAKHPHLRSPTVVVELAEWCRELSKCKWKLDGVDVDVATPAALLALVRSCPSWSWNSDLVRALWPSISAVVAARPANQAMDSAAADLLVWYQWRRRDDQTVTAVVKYMRWGSGLVEACASLEGAASDATATTAATTATAMTTNASIGAAAALHDRARLADLRRALDELSSFLSQLHREAELALVESGLHPIDFAGLPVGAADPHTRAGRAAAAYHAASIDGAFRLLTLLEDLLTAFDSAVHDDGNSMASASYVLPQVLSYLWQWLLMPAKDPADPVVGRLDRIWHHFAEHPTLKSPTVAVELSKWCTTMRGLCNPIATPAALLAVVSRCAWWDLEQVKNLWPAICAVITWWPNAAMDTAAARLLVWFQRRR